jgi:WD40 repeat protein
MVNRRIAAAAAACSVALALVVLSSGCREQEAEKSSPPSKTPVAERGGGEPKPRPYTLRTACAAFSPDGKQVLVGFGHDILSGAKKPPGWSVQLFDVETGNHLRTFNGHQGDVNFVAFFPDGKTAISAGQDGWCRVWELDKGVELHRFAAKVEHAALLPDGKRMLCSFRKLELWDAVEGRRLNEYDQFKNAVSSITVSPDGKLALLGCVPGGEGVSDLTVLRLWDIEKGKVVRKFDPKKDRLTHPNAFSEDSKLAVAVAWNADWKRANAVLWDVSSGNKIKELPAFDLVPLAIYLSLKDNRIVIAGDQGELVRLEARSSKELWARAAPTKGEAIQFFVFSRNGKLGLSGVGGRDNNSRQRMDLILWNTETGEELGRLRPKFEMLVRDKGQ